MEKFFVQNFGCRATQADGAALESMLAGKGLITWIGFVRPPLYPIFVAACYALGGIATLQVQLTRFIKDLQ